MEIRVASHLIHLRHTLKKLAEKGPQPNIHLQIKTRTEEIESQQQDNGDLSIRECHLTVSTWYITSWKSTGNVRAASSSSFKLQWTRVSSLRQKKTKKIRKKSISQFTFNMRYSTRNGLLLTRSKTRENSGVLRVFKGNAGLRVNCSSVSGGTCLMKKYLKAEEQKQKRPSFNKTNNECPNKEQRFKNKEHFKYGVGHSGRNVN